MQSIARRLETLVRHPNESLDVEIKDWLKIDEPLHKADLAKAMLALANHGGGFILIGFRKVSGVYQPIQADPEVIKLYDQDRINGIVSKYSDPPFHVECYIIQGEKEKHPVIVVPGGHSVPIRCTRSGPEERHTKQNAYYIRRPGPASEEPQSAKEWSDLIRRCIISDKENLIESLRSLLNPVISEPSQSTHSNNQHYEWIKSTHNRFIELIKEKYQDINRSPFRYGYWEGAYSLFPQATNISLSDLYDKLSEIKGNETGWPIGIVMMHEGARPYPNNGCIETWLGNIFSEPDTADFWRFSPKGSFSVYRGYQEDVESSKKEPGTLFDFIIPVWRVAEFLLHGYRFAKAFNLADSSMQVTIKWNRLKGRSLTSLSWRYYLSLNRRVSMQDSVESNLLIDDVSLIDVSLPDFVEQILKPLYEAFDFFVIPKQTIINEIKTMRMRS
jgi:hypothetical protein